MSGGESRSWWEWLRATRDHPTSSRSAPRVHFTFIVDYISYLCLSVAIGVGIALVFGQEGIDALERVPNLIVGMAIITAYYVFFEAIWGRTPGKFLMGTVVVTEHGEKPSFGQIIGRTLCRFIPFEPLSCLGERGWHDSIPKVLVVNARGR